MTTLNSTWVIWFHNPTDNNWELSSYMNLGEIDSIESFWDIYLRLSQNVIQEGMFFLMKKGIKPLWENEENINGGCWSYKVSKKDAYTSWIELSINTCCETLIQDFSKLNGISISPKKLFCILKIWNNDSSYSNKNNISTISNLNKDNCIYKSHKDRN